MKAGLTGVIGTYRGLRHGFSFKRMKALLENAPLKPLHPGIFLRDKAFPASRMSRTEMAGVMGMSLTHLRLVMNGKRPVTPDIAACLGKMFGNGPGAWIAMQAAYDEWVALYETDVSSVPALTAPLLAIANDESQLPSPPRRSGMLLVAAACGLVLLVAIGMIFVALLPVFLCGAFLAGGATVVVLQRLRIRLSGQAVGPPKPALPITKS